MFEKRDTITGTVVCRTPKGFYAKLDGTDLYAFVKADCPLGSRVTLTVLNSKVNEAYNTIFCALDSFRPAPGAFTTAA